MGFTDAPAGKHGRVIARPDGRFAFEKTPDRPARFYGINLCFGAHYLEKAEADRLAERLQRLGYNALRIHHYERELVSGQGSSTALDPAKLDQLDYLVSALISKGIYLTTDLFVSRPVPWKEIGTNREGTVPMNTFKVLVPVHEGAYRNWREFSRALLLHVNPYTKRSYAQEPALGWLAMINEGNLGNFFKEAREFTEWTQAWNRWLNQKYFTREKLRGAWGGGLGSEEDLAKGNVALPERLQADGARARDCVAFLADTERDMVIRMRNFLRNELGCKALVSNASSWTRFTTDQWGRTAYDYVDDHFYVDHPQFLEGSWRLPSRCPNTSPISEGAPGGRPITFTRLFDKPFTLTEYNYSGPGRFRGVGGILTGAMGSLQGWGGIWRFAYSHGREAMFNPSPMGYFDVVSDPLSQAAERASLCLFLRGDMGMAPESVALVMTEPDLKEPADRIPTLAPKWHWLAWVTRVGTRVVARPDSPVEESAIVPLGWRSPASAYPAHKILDIEPYTANDEQVISALEKKKLVRSDSLPRPRDGYFRSVTGEITIDGPNNRMVLDTPRTAGGFAPAGQSFSARTGGVSANISGADSTVWVSALDGKPIHTSNRLLVTHLTDLQNTGIQYKEEARQTLLAWGRLPYLVRAGSADMSVRMESPSLYQVWALSPGGTRIGKVPARVRDEYLEFRVDVGADPEAGARMLYEIARE